jgi:hypothetical protein
VGLPETRATATTRDEAIKRVCLVLQAWLASGQLEVIEMPQKNPLVRRFNWIDPNDPEEQVFRAELERLRREDLERTLREYEQECSDSPSTPTT